MNPREVAERLYLHELWLRKEPDGVRADLSLANLAGYNFKNAILRRVHFAGANLEGAIFTFADCRNADFRQAVLRNAFLQGANMSLCDFTGAVLDSVQYDGWTSFFNAGDLSVLTATWKRHQIVSIDANAAVGCQFAPLTEWATSARLLSERSDDPYKEEDFRYYIPILRAFYRERVREGVIKKEKQ